MRIGLPTLRTLKSSIRGRLRQRAELRLIESSDVGIIDRHLNGLPNLVTEVAPAEVQLQETRPELRGREVRNIRMTKRVPKVSLIGPWNYASGLGMASRGYISALWQSGLQVNLHPIYRPFHIHGRSALTIDVCDFDGPADVCIIHLNPDAWPGLLEDRHYRQIMGAKKRVGLWVWEMETIPKQWSTAFREVDAVWAPSNYCRAAFELASAAPVRVLPHVVMAPAPNLRPSQMREKLGLPSNRQLILYNFDGASYLIRKNPFALVRAFGASGLHRQGWSLVLKTKNLMDRPDVGRELVSLIEGFREVYLINQNLSQYENFALMESCSVYASPHSAEGFGLTVAEAMALGKIVVATDYSGTRDFLDSTCGFPVKWRKQQLDRSHGHYFRGGVWAEIDEVDLARALNDAARAAADPDQVIGHAAAARIRTQLSPISIGACIRELIQDLVQ